jgi:hypothetical protein
VGTTWPVQGQLGPVQSVPSKPCMASGISGLEGILWQGSGPGYRMEAASQELPAMPLHPPRKAKWPNGGDSKDSMGNLDQKEGEAGPAWPSGILHRSLGEATASNNPGGMSSHLPSGDKLTRC